MLIHTFLASKACVAPLEDTTILRLELLSALLLAKLVTAIETALEEETNSLKTVCYADSMATLYWIKRVNHK